MVEGAATGVGGTGEELLAGGRTSVGVVRIGQAVHRPVRRWTNTVHAVLRHLERVGFTQAPRVLGFDDAGREVLTYLEGETAGEAPWPAWVFSDEALTQVGSWLRRLHDATVDFVPPEDAEWFAGQRWRPGLVIGHHDAAPYNAVWRQGRLVGFVDWDVAGPSSREFDLAFSALMWVPLLAPGSAWPTAGRPVEERHRRLHLLLDAYGYDQDRSALREAVASRARRNAEVSRRLADDGDPVFQALKDQAADLDRSAQQVDELPESFWRRPVADLGPRLQEPPQAGAGGSGE
jgi:aminoglycoside phosphotransferase